MVWNLGFSAIPWYGMVLIASGSHTTMGWYGILLVSYHGMVYVWDIPWDIRMGYLIAGHGIALAGHGCWPWIARVD